MTNFRFNLEICKKCQHRSLSETYMHKEFMCNKIGDWISYETGELQSTMTRIWRKEDLLDGHDIRQKECPYYLEHMLKNANPDSGCKNL